MNIQDRRKIFPKQIQEESQQPNENERLNEPAQKQETNQFFLSNQLQPASTNNVQTKGPHSYVPSEANPSLYSIIEKNKLLYIECYNQFSEMRVVENLAGLREMTEKAEILNAFQKLFEEMLNCFGRIEKAVLQINFDTQDFQSQFHIQPSHLIELIYKDIKTLEGLHIEMIYSSSLRYLETVLEAQEIDGFKLNLYEFDVKRWSQDCLTYIFKFKSSPRASLQQNKKSCFASLCYCFYNNQVSQENVDQQEYQ